MRLLEAGCFTTFLLGQSSSRTIIERNSFWSSSILDPGAYLPRRTDLDALFWKKGEKEQHEDKEANSCSIDICIGGKI